MDGWSIAVVLVEVPESGPKVEAGKTQALH
jgi:hypothetical protein